MAFRNESKVAALTRPKMPLTIQNVNPTSLEIMQRRIEIPKNCKSSPSFTVATSCNTFAIEDRKTAPTNVLGTDPGNST
jgi:hypothetical protein